MRARPGPAATTDLYAHKLFAPRGHADTVPRSDILQRIFAEGAPRVVLLQGPAGHGKTTTLQQLQTVCEQRGCLTSWLTFDEADNDARRGFLHIHAAVRTLLGAAGQDVAEEDAASPFSHARSDWMIGQWQRIPGEAAIFFDEFQAVQEKSLLAFFRTLPERVPANIRIFIASRAIPEIGLSRLLIGNQAVVVHAGDLRVSPHEMRRFFAGFADLSISAAELEGNHPYWSWCHVQVFNIQTGDMTRLEQVRAIPGGHDTRVNQASIYDKYLTNAALMRLGAA